MPTPQFAFRATPSTVAAVKELQAALATKRGAPVSKAEAITFAVERAAEDLRAGDVLERMTSIELRQAARAAEERERRAEERARSVAVRYETDAEGRTVTIEQRGFVEVRTVDMGIYNPSTGRCEPRKPAEV